MTCEPLPSTGAPVIVLLLIAAALLATGVSLVFAARWGRGRTAVLVTALLLGVSSVAVSAGPPRARAAEPCGAGGTPNGSTVEPAPTTRGAHPDHHPHAPLEIEQTSINVGIAPGTAATPITGRMVNHGPKAVRVETITVEIQRVIKAASSVEGRCDNTDYDLREPVMHLGVTLAPGDGSAFSGASIGFHNKPVNQNACQAATVVLSFRTS